jgi:hypothetical protein
MGLVPNPLGAACPIPGVKEAVKKVSSALTGGVL